MKPSPDTDSFLPKSILSLRHYSLRLFSHDLIAGVTVGLVALPLAMAFRSPPSRDAETDATR